MPKYRVSVMLREYKQGPVTEFSARTPQSARLKAWAISKQTPDSIAFSVEARVPSKRAAAGYVWKTVVFN